MPYGLPAFDFDSNPAWMSRGQKVVHEFTIAAANCRAAKTDVDFTIDLIVSECVSKDTCAPFIKNYHKFGVQASAYEIIEFIGKGCLMFIASYNWTRRHAETDAGNFVQGTSARDSLDKLFSVFDSENGASAIHLAAFPPKASVRRACPDVA